MYLLCKHLIRKIKSKLCLDLLRQKTSYGTCELPTILSELGFVVFGWRFIKYVLWCKSAIMLVSNVILHERSKHIKVAVHFIWKKVLSGVTVVLEIRYLILGSQTCCLVSYNLNINGWPCFGSSQLHNPLCLVKICDSEKCFHKCQSEHRNLGSLNLGVKPNPNTQFISLSLNQCYKNRD